MTGGSIVHLELCTCRGRAGGFFLSFCMESPIVGFSLALALLGQTGTTISYVHHDRLFYKGSDGFRIGDYKHTVLGIINRFTNFGENNIQDLEAFLYCKPS